MKKAYHYTDWRLNDKKEFCGINFGYDFCAEHEFGIAGIREGFGIKTYTGNQTINAIKKFVGTLKPTLGIDARLITQKPLTLQFRQKGDFCAVYYASSKFSDSILEEGIKSLAWEMNKPHGKDLLCYWGDDSFMIITTNQDYYLLIRKAFAENNIAIFTAGKNGLVICMPNKLDDRTKTELYSSDLNMWELKQASDETGIERELKSAKKEMLVLTPGWKNRTTKEVHYWMNPKDQQKYNHGWFTAAELKEWINEKGPIIKTTETKIKNGNTK